MTLSWSVTAGDVLSINNGGGAVSGTTGRVTVLPSIATTYILTDDDSDGLSNALEYALGGANGSNNIALLPAATLAFCTVGAATDNYLTLVIHRPLSPDRATITTEWSPDLSAGSRSLTGVLATSIVNGDGTVTDTWRCPLPASTGRYFGRVKVTLP